MAAALTLDHLRHHAVARTLFAPTTLPRAIDRLGFVQADPMPQREVLCPRGIVDVAANGHHRMPAARKE